MPEKNGQSSDIYLSAFGMLKEFYAQSFIEMSALNDSREISEENLSIIDELCIADVRAKSCEGVMPNFRERPCELYAINLS